MGPLVYRPVPGCRYHPAVQFSIAAQPPCKSLCCTLRQVEKVLGDHPESWLDAEGPEGTGASGKEVCPTHESDLTADTSVVVTGSAGDVNPHGSSGVAAVDDLIPTGDDGGGGRVFRQRSHLRKPAFFKTKKVLKPGQ
jgi:hypothetical protein